MDPTVTFMVTAWTAAGRCKFLLKIIREYTNSLNLMAKLDRVAAKQLHIALQTLTTGREGPERAQEYARYLEGSFISLYWLFMDVKFGVDLWKVCA